MRLILGLSVGALVVGCTRVESTSNQTISALGVSTLEGDLEGGDVTYEGRDGAEEFSIVIESWGRARSGSKAEVKRDANTFDVASADGTLRISADSDYQAAGVDFDIDGPRFIDTDIVTERGKVTLSDVQGTQWIEAASIRGVDVSGTADLLATDGAIDLELDPYDGTHVRVETLSGSVTLRLPFGRSYDLQAWGDPEHEMTIEDLGFTNTVWGDGYFAGTSGDGSLQVNVYIHGGSFTLREQR